MSLDLQVNGEAVVGDRVSYEDMANPLRVGTVTEINVSVWGTDYRVEWDAEFQQATAFGPDAGTVSDLRQHGWRFVLSENDRAVAVACDYAARLVAGGHDIGQVLDAIDDRALSAAADASRMLGNEGSLAGLDSRDLALVLTLASTEACSRHSVPVGTEAH